jgi:hypothetical protein
VLDKGEDGVDDVGVERPQPVFLFSPAQLAQDERYAPAFEPASATRAEATERSGFDTVPASQLWEQPVPRQPSEELPIGFPAALELGA